MPDGTGLSQVEPASGLAPSGFDPSRVAKALSPIQTTILTRGVIKMAGLLVPRHHPQTPDRTWLAVERKGLIAKGRFGYALTYRGEMVRAWLSDRDRSGEADETAQQAQPEARARAEGIAPTQSRSTLKDRGEGR